MRRQRRFAPTVDGLEARLTADGDGGAQVMPIDDLLPGPRVDMTPEEAGYLAGLAGSSLTGGDWGGLVEQDRPDFIFQGA